MQSRIALPTQHSLSRLPSPRRPHNISNQRVSTGSMFCPDLCDELQMFVFCVLASQAWPQPSSSSLGGSERPLDPLCQTPPHRCTREYLHSRHKGSPDLFSDRACLMADSLRGAVKGPLAGSPGWQRAWTHGAFLTSTLPCEWQLLGTPPRGAEHLLGATTCCPWPALRLEGIPAGSCSPCLPGAPLGQGGW